MKRYADFLGFLLQLLQIAYAVDYNVKAGTLKTIAANHFA
jgi:hypothetical protein